jgi:hypothetical protein
VDWGLSTWAIVMRIERRLPTIRVRFPFETYIHLILGVLPPSDLIGIREIRVVERLSGNDSSDTMLGCYYPGRSTRDGVIEIHLPNILKHITREGTFRLHPEIAAYKLSWTLCHEVGYHAHRAWRHGVKKPQREVFAERSAHAGAFAYLKSRSSKIFSSYRWASWDFLFYGFKGVRYWRKTRRELLQWLDSNESGIEFP